MGQGPMGSLAQPGGGVMLPYRGPDWTCPSCGHDHSFVPWACWHCGAVPKTLRDPDSNLGGDAK
jgi:rubrerythrin